jgi:leader peptidase (prepilin peptidase) / N-methyltransferase
VIWAYAALALALGVAAALLVRTRRYRRDDDVVRRTLSPWWVPAGAVLGTVIASPFYAGAPAVVSLTYLLALVWGLGLALIDLDVRRLPVSWTVPAYPAAAVALAACSAATDDWAALARAAACAGIAVAVFGVVALLPIDVEGLGLGDVTLAGVLAGLLGWMSWYHAVLGLAAGCLLGGFVVLVLALSRRARWHSHLPYGPVLIAGACLFGALRVG